MQGVTGISRATEEQGHSLCGEGVLDCGLGGEKAEYSLEPVRLFLDVSIYVFYLCSGIVITMSLGGLNIRIRRP